jgi:hypothetical protein
MAVKLKFNDEAKNYTDEPRFILDSGAHDSQSRGFSLHYQDGRVHCVVAISNAEWKVSVSINNPKDILDCLWCIWTSLRGFGGTLVRASVFHL